MVRVSAPKPAYHGLIPLFSRTKDFENDIHRSPTTSDGLSSLRAWGSGITRGLFFILFLVLKADHN